MLSRLLLTVLLMVQPFAAQAQSSSIDDRVCTIEYKTDRPGGDYKRLRAPQLQDCVDACQYDSACVTAQYHTSRKYCYLKRRLNRPKQDANVDGVVCSTPTPVPTTTTTTTTATTTTSSTATPTFCKQLANPYTAINGKKFNIECDMWWYLYQIIRWDQNVFDFRTCVETCADEPECIALTYGEYLDIWPDYPYYKGCITLRSIAYGGGDNYTFPGLQRATLIT